MSYYCEMCGREVDTRDAKKAVVEGSVLILCPQCYSKLSKQGIAREVPKPVPQHARRQQVQSQVTKPSRRIEEYEVVEDYAVRIKRARERSGWSQEVLAMKVGESVNTIKRIEAGKLKPSIELARKLEKVLGIKLLEPVVDEVEGVKSSSKQDYLTIGDLIRLEEEKG